MNGPLIETAHDGMRHAVGTEPAAVRLAAGAAFGGGDRWWQFAA
jgi:hypothetical protein